MGVVVNGVYGVGCIGYVCYRSLNSAEFQRFNRDRQPLQDADTATSDVCMAAQ